MAMKKKRVTLIISEDTYTKFKEVIKFPISTHVEMLMDNYIEMNKKVDNGGADVVKSRIG